MINQEFDLENFKSSLPFNHLVIDNFLEDLDFAHKLESEFFDYDASEWHVYSNGIEEKKTCNTWNLFKPNTYRYFQFINSPEFIKKINRLVDTELFADYCRRSLASYYLQKPDESCDSRSRALFAPRESQKDDSGIKELCKKRSSEDTVAETYVTKK